MVRHTIALVGGNGRDAAHLFPHAKVRTFPSPKNGGNGVLKRLEAALRSGTIDEVVLVTRRSAHSVTRRVRRLCRMLGIPVSYVA